MLRQVCPTEILIVSLCKNNLNLWQIFSFIVVLYMVCPCHVDVDGRRYCTCAIRQLCQSSPRHKDNG